MGYVFALIFIACAIYFAVKYFKTVEGKKQAEHIKQKANTAKIVGEALTQTAVDHAAVSAQILGRKLKNAKKGFDKPVK
jgi:large-conductance mechanosensitive channel